MSRQTRDTGSTEHKIQNDDKQNKNMQKTKKTSNRSSPKTKGELMCLQRVSSYYFTQDTCHVTRNQVLSAIEEYIPIVI